MEIDKKIIRKLIEVLEIDLKKSLNGNDIINSDKPIEEETNENLRIVIKSPLVGTAYLVP